MTNKLSRWFWILTLFLLASGLAVQWWRAEDAIERAEARILNLSMELEKAAKIKRQEELLNQDLKTIEAGIADLRVRLPATSDTEGFAQAVIAGMQERDVGLVLEENRTVDKEFYSETVLTFDFSGAIPSPAELDSVIPATGRIVHREMQPETGTLVLRIFSCAWDPPAPRSHWCDRPLTTPGFLWHFTRSLRQRQGELAGLCDRRKRETPILERIGHWENRRQLQLVLAEIVSALDPDSEIKPSGVPYPLR